MTQDTTPSAPSKRWIWIALIAITILSTGADQLTKYWAYSTLRNTHHGHLNLYHGKSLNISMTFVKNPGAAWGFLANQSKSFRVPFFITLTLLAMAYILFLLRRLEPHQRMLALALALIFSGALGNVIDRAHLTYVIDFIDFRFGTFRWPTFNVADIAISVGVGLIVLDTIVDIIRKRRLNTITDEREELNAEKSN